MAELKSCPFCGGKKLSLIMADDRQIPYINKSGKSCLTPLTHYVACGGCGAKTFYFENCNDAIDAWNRRVTDG